MAKPKVGAKKSKVAPKKGSPKLSILKSASKKVARLAKKAVSVAKKAAAPKKVKAVAAKKGVAPGKGVAPKKGKKLVAAAPVKGKAAKAPTGPVSQKREPGFMGPMPDKPLPRASKLPPVGELLNKRDMEQLLTAGMGRGVEGEGGLKGKLIVRDGFPYLQVAGRDKRELVFLLQGPDQEVLPAYIEHKVSVVGRIKKTTNYGGIVDVRKYSAKKPEAEVVAAPVEEKLKFLSPGEVVQICSGGMGAGMKGFAAVRGGLEMTGDSFFLVVANGGTRQQVSFVLTGKLARGLKKYVGHTIQVTGVVEKNTGFGGTINLETVELRASEWKPIDRKALRVTHIDASGSEANVEVKINEGLEVVFSERANFTWAIEPAMAKRIGLREANFMPSHSSPAKREFFFTPRNPGMFEVEFFLAKAFTPTQVSKTFKLTVNVN